MSVWHAIIPVSVQPRKPPRFNVHLAGQVVVMHDGRAIGHARVTSHPDGTAVSIDATTLKAEDRQLLVYGYTPILKPKIGKVAPGRFELVAVELLGLDISGESVELQRGPVPKTVVPPIPPRPQVDLTPIPRGGPR